ncbi:MAG: phosphotransferase system enzyme I (PtsI) [bacterium]|jgi:phosphotransferase system enzyme I (PtsI)
MEIFRGVASSEGIAIGRAFTIDSSFSQFSRIELDSHQDIDKEIARIHSAHEEALQQFEEIEKRSENLLEGDLASLLTTHRLFLQDKRLLPAVEEKILDWKINAEWALSLVMSEIRTEFDQIEDSYLRSRFDDIRQISERLMSNLRQRKLFDFSQIHEPIILLCPDISPADAVHLAQGKVMGIVTEIGGMISHTSIIARAMGIPAVVGVEGITDKIASNVKLIIDGSSGEIIKEPDEVTLRKKVDKKGRIQFFQNKLEDLKTEECQLEDGRKVDIAANLDFMGELELIKQNNIRSVGLIRTEFLFINNSTIPTEDKQFQEFEKIFKELKNIPLTIRTWDLSPDKAPKFFPIRAEEANPALGSRAVRLCLRHEDIFRSQIRAILRMSAITPVRLLLPMITNLDEVLKSIKLIEEEKDRLGFSHYNIAVGCMIETPAAAMIIDEILDVSDFVSIGSNDLVQYTLAVDRINEHVAHLYTPFHPAILRLLEQVVKRSNVMNVPVSICGEMAADPFMQMFLLGIGEITFSMCPNRVLFSREILRKVSSANCKKVAFRFLSKRTLLETTMYLKELRELYLQGVEL